MFRRTFKAVCRRCGLFVRGEDGPSATEYAILLAVLVLIAVASIRQIGEKIHFVYQNIETAVATAGM